ncbi:MAG TPA: histidine kinase [Gryllotalpicola sp.]
MNALFARFRAGFTGFATSQGFALWAVRLLPLAAAIVFAVVWAEKTYGAWPWEQKLVATAAWASVLAIAGFFPWATVIGSLVVLACEWLMALFLASTYHGGLGWALNLGDGTWKMWWAVPIALAYATATAVTGRLKIAALIAGVVGAIGYAALLAREGWPNWLIEEPSPYRVWAWHSLAEHPFLGFVQIVFPLLALVVVSWAIGFVLSSALLRTRLVTTRLEVTAAQLDDAGLELRLAHDRGRISRDIHDSLAHSLAIIVAQAEGAAAIHELKPAAAPESLSNIATVARGALVEVRRLVERINDDEDLSEHTSRLEHIPGLVDEVRSVGVDAALRVLGDPGPLALSKQVAAYRIVQESLTNALKHGGRGTAATVTLDAQGAGLAVLVVSKSGGGEPLVSGGGRGIGIPGMKERARLVGGWLTAVPSDDETFVVTAFIPPDETAGADRRSGQPGQSGRLGHTGEASDEFIDAESETGALAIETARG